MIIDTFMFFNEVDLLESRIRYLWNVIDYFVIVESNVTHSGKPKKMFFKENTARFEKYKLKIIYCPFYFDNTAHGLDFSDYNMSYLSSNFKFVELQRNHITQAVSMFDKKDTILVSDVDEIPAPWGIRLVADSIRPKFKWTSFTHRVFHYDLQHMIYAPQSFGSVAATNELVQDIGAHGVKEMKAIVHDDPRFANAGWHLKYFGTMTGISEKIKASAKQELNVTHMADRNFIRAAYRAHANVYGSMGNRFYRPDQKVFPTDFWDIFKQFYFLRDE